MAAGRLLTPACACAGSSRLSVHVAEEGLEFRTSDALLMTASSVSFLDDAALFRSVSPRACTGPRFMTAVVDSRHHIRSQSRERRWSHKRCSTSAD